MTETKRMPPKPWIRPAQKQCGNCNRWMPKAKKVFKGIPYCDACYAREFHRVPCTRCSKTCRKHYSAYDALCPTCIKEERRCLRCERPVPRAALMVNEQPVCPSCVRYFKEVKRTRPVGHATCRVCRKPRFAVGQDERGRPICKACNERDRTEEVAAQHKAYWSSSLAKRSTMAAASLRQTWAAELWRQFVAYRAAGAGPMKITLRVPDTLEFFTRLDDRFVCIEDISGATLCENFTGDELRRHWKALAFLASLSIDIPSQEQKVAAIESARIQRMIEQASHLAHAELLRDYAQATLSRIEKGQGPTLTTLRTNLRAAIGLCAVAGMDRLSQFHVDRYLRNQPGQRAALSGFVGFLNREGFVLRLPPKKGTGKRVPELVGQPVTVWEAGAQSPVLGEAAAAVVALLMHSLGVAQSKLLATDRRVVQRAGDVVTLAIEDTVLTLDLSLGRAISAYLKVRDERFGAEGFLFPGRHALQAMSVAGVNYHLSKWHTPAASIAAPARRALKIHSARIEAD